MSVLVLAVLLASCSSDDDSTVQTGIVGKWTLMEANVENPVDLNGDGTANPNIMRELECFSGTLMFRDDGTFKQTFAKIEEVEVNGVFTYDCDGEVTNTGSYELDGDQLTLITDGPEPTTSVTTISLNGNILMGILPDYGNLGDVQLVYSRNM